MAKAGTSDEGRLLGHATLAARRDGGDPRDDAVFRLAEETLPERFRAEVVENLPFTEDRKRQTAVVRLDGGQLLATIKGTAKVILGMWSPEDSEQAVWHGAIARLTKFF